MGQAALQAGVFKVKVIGLQLNSLAMVTSKVPAASPACAVYTPVAETKLAVEASPVTVAVAVMPSFAQLGLKVVVQATGTGCAGVCVSGLTVTLKLPEATVIDASLSQVAV